jgi:hypothetical protein
MLGVAAQDEVQQELGRILESPWFRNSAALKNLLRHLVEQTLAGQGDSLKEYVLGLEVFHRPPNYDPRNDAIVRVQASSLRKKLAAFYENEGRDSTIRIEIPRGGYVPVFQPVPTAPEFSPNPPAVAPSLQFSWLAFLAGAVLASALTFLLVRVRSPDPLPAPVGKSVWGGMTVQGRPVIVGMGMPLFYTGGNGVYFRDTQRNQSSSGPGERLLKLERTLGFRLRTHNDVYTGVGEAMGVARISRWLDRFGADVQVANSHYLGPSDLTGKDLVVVSSMRFQTLLNAMDLPKAFSFDETGSGSFVNLQPLPGEPVSFGTIGVADGVTATHALLSVYGGSVSRGRIVHAGGTHSWGTHGVAQFMVDEGQLRDLDLRLAQDPERGPRGLRSDSFQVILRVEGKNDQVRAVEYVTHRYLP